VLFIDEVHRFSKTQQDSLLSAVEDRIVSLIAATTENPFFSVVSPLLSRSLVLALQPLSDDDIRAVLHRALTSDRGLDGAVTLTGEAEEHLLRIAGGDARKALTALESGAGAATSAGSDVLDLATLETAVAQAAVRYDRQGDQHYDIASALIKSIRGSDVDAALHYLARMVAAGEDPRFIARRLVISASEDIGMADPTALLTAVAAADAVAFIGMPEGHFPLAQAVVHLATAPKSNAITAGIGESMADVHAGLAGPVPPGLRDAHYAGAKKLGHGATYDYPHAHPDGVVPQQYPPDALVGKDYYRPTSRGAEARLVERLAKLRAIVRRQPREHRSEERARSGPGREA
jgi:putative ATPase